MSAAVVSHDVVSPRRWHSALPGLPVGQETVEAENRVVKEDLGGGGGVEVGLAPYSRRLAWPSALSCLEVCKLTVLSAFCFTRSCRERFVGV